MRTHLRNRKWRGTALLNCRALRDLVRRALPQIAEAILIPLGLFYAGLSVLGPKGAICTALAWNIVALLRRLCRRERLPGVLLLGTVGLTARSVVALVSSSSLFVYFLQPSLGTALLGGAFLLSVPLGCPLAEKLAHDFVPLPASFFKRPKVRQLFVRISLLWALVSLTNAAGTLALLLDVPITTFLAARTGLSWALTIAGVVLSSWWFRRSLRRDNAQPVVLAAGVSRQNKRSSCANSRAGARLSLAASASPLSQGTQAHSMIDCRSSGSRCWEGSSSSRAAWFGD